MRTHGTVAMYVSGCRCSRCRMANTIYYREWKSRKTREDIPAEKHGRMSTYNNYDCRCDACSAAKREYNRQYQAQVSS